MHLEMRFEANGDVRPIWYGRFMINGKKECVNLGVKLAGDSASLPQVEGPRGRGVRAVARHGRGAAEAGGGGGAEHAGFGQAGGEAVQRSRPAPRSAR